MSKVPSGTLPRSLLGLQRSVAGLKAKTSILTGSMSKSHLTTLTSILSTNQYSPSHTQSQCRPAILSISSTPPPNSYINPVPTPSLLINDTFIFTTQKNIASYGSELDSSEYTHKKFVFWCSQWDVAFIIV